MKPLKKVEAIIVHHTASRALSTSVEDVRRWHLERGFEDVGYHYILEWNGEKAEVRKGRPDLLQGAHTRGWNSRSIGVAIVGSWEHAGWHGIPAELRATLVDVVDNLLRLHDLYPEHVMGHREAHRGHTVCPGFEPEELRRELRRRPQVFGP